MEKKLYDNYVKILHKELIPAMGCTEPIAIAYAASILRHALGADPTALRVELSGNIIKNVKSVIVPATDGMHGIEAAVAAMRAINALSLANFLAGSRKISFDLVVETMYHTGLDLSHLYRETSEGGLAKLYHRPNHEKTP
jgi:L-cysteine desulfidase